MSAAEKWFEYHVHNEHDKGRLPIPELEKLGFNRWELVSVVIVQGGSTYRIFYFKRENWRVSDDQVS